MGTDKQAGENFPGTHGWIVRYFVVDRIEQTAHFPDNVYTAFPDSAWKAAIEYARNPTSAGAPVLRVEVGRYVHKWDSADG